MRKKGESGGGCGKRGRVRKEGEGVEGGRW